jgi:hypothetical protein
MQDVTKEILGVEREGRIFFTDERQNITTEYLLDRRMTEYLKEGLQRSSRKQET